jgi:hypothetical protein
MHMKASPSCCRFALNLGKQPTTPRGSKPTNPPPADDGDDDDDESLTMTTSWSRDNNSTISALTDIQYELEPPTPDSVHCPNPNCPKSKTKLNTGCEVIQHMKASPSCNAYFFLIALWYQYRHLNDGDNKKPAQRTSSDDEASIMTYDESDDCSVRSDDHPDAGQHACPNPNCPMSTNRRYTNDEYTVHMNRSTSCFGFIVLAVRNHERVVSSIQE